MTSTQIRKMVYMAFTAALTVLLAKLTRFPPFPSAPYLKLEFSEIPLLLLCMFGSFPMGLVSLFLKELLSLLFWGTNVFALTADFAACAVFLGAFSFCCKKQFGTVRLLVSFLIAAVVRVLAAIPLNLLILPLQSALRSAAFGRRWASFCRSTHSRRFWTQPVFSSCCRA